MPLDTQIRDLTSAMRQAAVGRLTRQRLIQLQDLVQQLGEVLTTASAALQGRVDLTGDLWPEAEDDDVEETAMETKYLLDLIDALDEAGVTPHARRDALARAEQHFGGHAVAEWELRDFAQQLRRDAPHFFRDQAATARPGLQTPALSAREKQRPYMHPYTPTAEQLKSLEGLPPAERTARYRQWQEQQMRSGTR